MKLLAFTLSLALGCSSPAPAPAPPPVAAPPPPAPAPPRAITVLKTSADAARVAADGKSHPLAVGDRLGPDESVRTGKGTASLDVVGAAEVEISPGTEVAVGEITATLSKVKLTDGRISAVVHPSDGRGFEVDVPSLGAQATAGAAAQFSMMARGGQVALATRAGSIKLAARGQSVQIGAGQISVVQHDQPPSQPQVVPASLFLKVAPVKQMQRERQTVVRGTTLPGAVISVGGVQVVSGPDGAFAATVALRDGANRLTIASEDALGRTQQAEAHVTVDNRAPDSKSKVEW